MCIRDSTYPDLRDEMDDVFRDEDYVDDSVIDEEVSAIIDDYEDYVEDDDLGNVVDKEEQAIKDADKETTDLVGIDLDIKEDKEDIKKTPEVKNLQKRMTEKIGTVIKSTAKKWLPKEKVKTKIATQFIGEGSEGSSTQAYNKMYAEENLSNTGNYDSSDIIYVSSNGRRNNRVNPVKDGV